MPCALFPDFVGNTIGCLVLGALSSEASVATRTRTLHGESTFPAVLPSPSVDPITRALRGGFCSVLTSMSQWMVVTAERFVDGATVDALFTLWVGTCASLLAFNIGRDIAVGMRRAVRLSPPALRAIVTQSARLLVEWPIVPSGFWVAIVLQSAWLGRGTTHWLVALLLAPIGTIVRLFLQDVLSSRVFGWPIGTFACNVLGTLAEAVFLRIAHQSPVVVGAMQGLCASLSTVASFVEEVVVAQPSIHASLSRSGCVYAILTFAVCTGLAASVRLSQS